MQNQLIDDLLDVSRIVSGKLRLDVKPIDPASFVEAAIGSLQLAAEARHLSVQKLIDDAEIRQQRNLALRMTEVSRDFSVQRQADLVQIQQGLGRLEGRTEAEAARAREMMNYIMRVSQPQPAR